jgi:Ran-binding protein 3
VGLTSKPPAAFGAATADASDDEKDDGSDGDSPSGIRSPRDEEVKDKRFYEQAVNTGEENETSIFLQRAKLYSFSAVPPSTEKKWVERGVGNLKLNVKLPPDDESQDGTDAEAGMKPQKKKKARFVMRAEGSHRVVLNSPVQKGSKFGEETGERPKGQKFYFLGQPEGSDRLETMILKASRTSFTRSPFANPSCDTVED